MKKKLSKANVKSVKVQKDNMITGGSGAAARAVREQAESEQSKNYLVIANSKLSGEIAVAQLGIKHQRAAIVTDPEQLDDIAVYPGEDVYMVMNGLIHAADGWIEALIACASDIAQGQQFNIKMMWV